MVPQFMVTLFVACVENAVSKQRHVTFDAAHADCVTASEKYFNCPSTEGQFLCKERGLENLVLHMMAKRQRVHLPAT